MSCSIQNDICGGGGIWNHYGSLTLIDSTVRRNYAYNGGGIKNGDYDSWYYGFEASLALNNSAVTDNTAYYRGGVSNLYGAVALTNSAISRNAAGGVYGGAGGGISNRSYYIRAIDFESRNRAPLPQENLRSLDGAANLLTRIQIGALSKMNLHTGR